jgi:hypothetical protein
MYDTIDKVLISQAFTGNFFTYFILFFPAFDATSQSAGKQLSMHDIPFKFVPSQFQTSLLLWRTNPAMRQVFNQYCSNIENIKGVTAAKFLFIM